MAEWDATKTVWHSADEVKVDISGTQYSLQDAINDGLIGAPQATPTRNNCVEVATPLDGENFTPLSLIINGENICNTSAAGCDVSLWSTDSEGNLLYAYDGVLNYIQDSSGKYWAKGEGINYDGDVRNGDTTSTELIKYESGCGLFDDRKLSGETSADEFIIEDGHETRYGLHSCHVSVCARN